MVREDNLVKTFANCFRLLAKTNAGIKDGFFVDLVYDKSERLLSDYTSFLKAKGDKISSNVAQTSILQQKIVAKYPDTVHYGIHVAQCRANLIYQIEILLLLLGIIKHLELSRSATPLLLERELLKLQLLLLNYNRPELSPRSAEVSGNLVINKNNDKNKNTKPVKLNELHRQITEFIQNKERVQNVEVFTQFHDTTRRTLKRKLSELVRASAIKRLVLGKKVFYAVLS